MSQHLNRMIAFAHAAREGSFSRAALRLGVTQSAVSQHIARLETELGQPLLVREREGLRLTANGQEIFELADQMLTLSTALDERIAGMSRLDQGHLTIIANSPRPALGMIGAFKARHPGVSLTFRLWDWTTSMRLVRERQCDIAFLTEPRGIGSCVTREIGRQAYMVYLTPEHPLCAQPSVSLADLTSETVLLPEEGSFTRRVVMAKLAERDIVLPNVISTATFPLMQDAVLHRVGVGIFLDDAAHESVSLVRRPIRDLPETYGSFVAFPQDKAHLRLIQAFVDLCGAGAPDLSAVS